MMCFIVPPYILRELAKRGTPEQQERAMQALMISERVRGVREALWPMLTPAGEKQRCVYDARHHQDLPGKLVRSEGGRPTKDAAVNEAYEGSGTVYDYYKTVHERNSVDDRGLRLDSSVHFADRYDNAFWNGAEMVYGDGDQEFFRGFTRCLDVIGHELTHGVTQYEARLAYRGQAGALNESMSDVFGSLIKQWSRRQKAADADWLIGDGVFTAKVKGRALRSMKEPGTAYDDPKLGKDPQPGHMDGYVDTHADNGGVHVNSGIPNRAFCLAALALGGYAWDKAGRIWYAALTQRLGPRSNFADAAQATAAAAKELFGAKEAAAVGDAWSKVGLLRIARRTPATA